MTYHIAQVLYELDPMGTCCKENELFDEYEKEAEMISNGISVKDTFFRCFWEDCLTSDTISLIENKLKIVVK